MNTPRTLIAAALFALTAVAHAEGPIETWPQDFSSQKSRAEVRQAAIDARMAGLIAQGEATPIAERFVPGKTRAQVVAELQEARRLGLVAHGDQHVLPTAQQNEQVRLAGLRAIDRNMAQAGAVVVR
jgi:hypothetical protein